MSFQRSKNLFKKAQALMPGGVNSPVRAFKSVGGSPLFFVQAKGAYLKDCDGNDYVDYVGSWGPMILGHAHPKVIAAVQETAAKGLSFGAPCELEIKLAQEVTKRVEMDWVRMVNSGTEALMGALRLARGVTGKNKIIKFSGCYHGHADYLLVEAGSGALTFGQPNSLGVPKEMVTHTLVAPYNDLDRVSHLVKKYGKDLAAIVVEPIAGNMGLVLPEKGFLEGLKKLAHQVGALLVFDEVMTGFRVGWGGAQTYLGLKPDLITLGKILGGGLPVGAYGGKTKYKKALSPEGGVYQAGTLSGNPVAMAAGLATLKLLKTSSYPSLAQKTKRLALGLKRLAEEANVSVQVPWVPGMLALYFSEQVVKNLKEAQSSQVELFKLFFHAMLKKGIYLPPSPYEAWFPSLAHGENEIALTLRAAKLSFREIKAKKK
ncbi:MAG: glutamate-1-semialdehyde 2,1-aminomutase [Deltaproteobacteria bacterium]|nr:glutamate-1-semialdehyde 2,1-aminomutase [Deltaproteobacteria bacterium]